MRFFEFAVGVEQIVDYKLKSLKEWYTENRRNGIINENTESLEKYNSIKEFLTTQITDPKDLTVGEKYYPIYIFAQPSASAIKLEVADAPVDYLGVNNNDYIFQGTVPFKIPVFSESVEDYTTLLFATTVYTTMDECNKFLMMVALKFEGKWKLQQKRLRV